MPHRADAHPSPPRGMLLRANPAAAAAAAAAAAGVVHHPHMAAYPAHPAAQMHPAQPPGMHPADVAASVAAHHRARYYGTATAPVTSSSTAAPTVLQSSLVKNQTNTKKRQKEESPEEAAASALLLAASGRSSSSATESSRQEDVQGNATKKHKKNQDVLRPNSSDKDTGSIATTNASNTAKHRTSTAASAATTDSNGSGTASQPCHVSPVSSSSVATTSTAEETVSTSNYATPGSRVSSYDLKEGHPLNPEDRIEEVIQQYFPTMLHKLLTNDDEFGGSVVQWLPHGRAWKVVRWDALKREVMPKRFPFLGNKTTKNNEGSIDTFLSHLRGWGFEEIKDGPDVGAYHHALFLREDARLCQKMRYAATEDDSPKPVPDKSKSGSTYATPEQQTSDATSPGTKQPHSILQVPSLRSDGVATSPQKAWPEAEQRSLLKQQQQEQQQQVESAAAAAAKAGYHPEAAAAAAAAWHWRPGVHYRPDYALHYQPNMVMAHHPNASNASAGRPWFPFGSHEQHYPQNAASSSPPRVRSTRGGARAAAAAAKAAQEAKKSSSSYPVSQRGKGPRSVARRPVVEHPHIAQGPEPGVAIATSKKTSMRKVVSADEQQQETPKEEAQQQQQQQSMG